MEEPKSLSVKVTLADDKNLTITLDVKDWTDLEYMVPDHVVFFQSWAEELDAHGTVSEA